MNNLFLELNDATKRNAKQNPRDVSHDEPLRHQEPDFNSLFSYKDGSEERVVSSSLFDFFVAHISNN